MFPGQYHMINIICSLEFFAIEIHTHRDACASAHYGLFELCPPIENYLLSYVVNGLDLIAYIK